MPGNAAVYQQLGNIRRRQGRWHETIEDYQRAAELDPRSHAIWFNLSDTYFITRQYTLAEQYVDRVIAIAPDFLDSYLLKAAVAIHRDGDVEAARQIMQQTAERIPPTQWRPMRSYWLFGFSRVLERSAEAARREMAPGSYGLDSSTYYLATAELIGRQGDATLARVYYDSALTTLEALVRDLPEQVWVQGQLGVARAAVGRVAGAVEAARRATELLPVERDALDGPDWVVNQAMVYLLLGQRDRAAAELERAVAMPSRVSPAWIRLDPFWEPLADHATFRQLAEGEGR
jgi:tetratricopeptide (TPR) repeat protein